MKLTEGHPIQCLDILTTTILIKFSLNLCTERELLPVTMQTCPAVERVLGSERGWCQPAHASCVAVASDISELRSLCWQDRAYDAFCIVIRNCESERRKWIRGVCRCKTLYGRKQAFGVTAMLSPPECGSSPENVLNMHWAPAVTEVLESKGEQSRRKSLPLRKMPEDHLSQTCILYNVGKTLI